MPMDYWIFVFNCLRDLREQPLRSWDAFREILDPIRDSIVEITPGISFETFPRAVPGYNVHMVRFRRVPDEGPEPPKAWAETGLPWLLLGARPRHEAPATLAHSQVDVALGAEFRYWLRSNLHVLHEPLE